MARVIITKKLVKEIHKKFKKESVQIFELMHSLKDHPKKGKPIGQVGGLAIKELKYKSFRFYFITDAYKVKFLEETALVDLLIQFVRMSDKKDQQKVIDEITSVLRTLGEKGFD